MSTGNWPSPKCLRCGAVPATRVNRLIGGSYCPSCDDFITKRDTKLEARYEKRVAARKAREVAS